MSKKPLQSTSYTATSADRVSLIDLSCEQKNCISSRYRRVNGGKDSELFFLWGCQGALKVFQGSLEIDSWVQRFSLRHTEDWDKGENRSLVSTCRC